LREYLRAHPEESSAYAKLKLDLYRQYPADYGAYRKNKDAYIIGLNERAEQWCLKQGYDFPRDGENN
jgi:GrpB-like predicted nucleotidyltransferase (UPF0157 family)